MTDHPGADFTDVYAATLPSLEFEPGIHVNYESAVLKIKDGLATQGLLVRHLVMPGNVAGSIDIIDFLANEISDNTFVNVMEQYRPTFKAKDFPEINRPITNKEFNTVYEYAKKRGLRLAD